MFRARAVAPAALVLALAAPAGAQVDAGQVAVDISAVRARLARMIDAEPARLPTTVQVPMSVAAAACGDPASDAATDARARAAGTECKASVATDALARAVAERLRAL